MTRAPGMSARLRLALSYAGFVVVAGALLMATVWVFLLRYVPEVIVSYPLGPPGQPGLFIPDRADLLAAFAPRAAVVLLLLLGFGLLGGWFLAGRMLAPLTRITHATRVAAGGSLAHRIRLAGRADEFRELADAFDSMLAQLEANAAEQQRFAANASHELRTPLAISRTLLDVARTDPDHDPRELVARLHAVNERAIHLTESLLLLSRGDRGAFARGPVDLSLLAEDAVETLLPLAEQRGVGLTVTASPAPTSGSADLLTQVVVNLVQNSVVHNLPAGGRAAVRTGTEGATTVLAVENTGPVLPADLVPTLVEPFRRGTERTRSDEHAGVGLGLAIVHSIVRAHDGTLDLAPLRAGGLRVEVRLPGGSAVRGTRSPGRRVGG
ncbi:sensor histidine kinase [Actinokineospora bangkokensis]|uniref:histidine kinase n=1 Tax=Actinokineospora bangkokensis TaxID=1193682 RepID=A0A1Q9LQV3_9PSEU|nr:HAMP domain-containing sensor histidine kinase [Actinokineospora bangkokensis]OLR94371.1 two-component sensor histidine kinase [Actinokineospora bangkokensis]